jgi:ribosomal protein S18 acetylase RimI-like enzyme
MNLIIRDAQTSEFDRVSLLSIESYQEYSQSLTSENWHKMKNSLANISDLAKQAKLIVAECNHELIGAVIYYRPGTSSSLLFQPEWASLRILSVLPKYRGQKIGRSLSQECIQRARLDRAEVIGLHTSELMITARKMYHKLGFQQDIELPQSLGIRYWRYVLRLTYS